MSGSSEYAIEDLNRGRLEARIREIARRLFAEQNLDDLEARHLARVVEHCSRTLSNVYLPATLDHILRGEAARPESPEDVMKAVSGGGRTPLRRVTRVPEGLREVGDRCLYDIGMAGVRDYNGLSLETLGIRSYRMAADILSLLAEERELRELFRRNRMGTLPIEAEVAFLRQCAARFSLHAHLLSNLRDVSAPLATGASPGTFPTYPERAAERGGEMASPVRGRRVSPPADAPAGARTAHRDLLLARYERMLLFAGTDFEKVRRELKGLVAGQDGAVEALCDDLLLEMTAPRPAGAPLAYALVGPPGVGRKHLMKSLAGVLGNSWNVGIPFLLIDGARFTPRGTGERFDVAGGEAPGGDAGLPEDFQTRASRSPLAILVVDDAGQAPPGLRRFLLTLLDPRVPREGREEGPACEGWILALTSNPQDPRGGSLEATPCHGSAPGLEAMGAEETDGRPRTALPPDLASSVRSLHFAPLSRASMEAILDRELAGAIERFRSLHRVQVRITPRARRLLLEIGFSGTEGARPLAAAVRRHCGVAVSGKIRRDGLPGGPAREEAIRRLRAVRRGEGVFDPEREESTALGLCQIRLPYRTLVIDESGGEFRYRGVD